MKYALLFFILMYADSCNSKQNDSDQIDGKWRIVSIQDKTVNSKEAIIAINPTNRSINASVGCNNHVGDVNILKDEIKINNLIGTEMYCQDLHAIERSLVSNLRIVSNYKFQDGKLMLFGPNGITVMELEKAKSLD